MQIVTRVTSAVQLVFGTLAEEIGRQCQLIQRQRVFTASSLAKTLVFGYLHNPRASWEELAEVAASCGASVSPQAIEQRFTPKLVAFLFRLCEAMTSQVVEPERISWQEIIVLYRARWQIEVYQPDYTSSARLYQLTA